MPFVMAHWIFLKYMAQRFVRSRFDFTCSFVFMINVYSDVDSFKLLLYVSTYFSLPIGGVTQSHQDDGMMGGLQHIGYISKKWRDLISWGHSTRGGVHKLISNGHFPSPISNFDSPLTRSINLTVHIVFLITNWFSPQMANC